VLGPGLEAHAERLAPVVRECGFTLATSRSAGGGGQVVLLGIGAGEAVAPVLDGCPPASVAVVVFLAEPGPQAVREAYRRGVAEVLLPGEQPLAAAVTDLLQEMAQTACAAGEAPGSGSGGLLGVSDRIGEINSMIALMGPADSTVLIQGASGTGKELAARAVHAASPRKDEPFVPINCGAIPADLLEAELFGHTKGAFTGAVRAREGRFAKAGAGTLFLDEIGEMSADLQIKLLRVLEERTYEPVGSSQPQRFDSRVLAATNQDLEEAVAEGRFREDLFHRLNVLSLELPTLSERGEAEIGYLFDYFLDHLNRQHGTAVHGVTPLARRLLTTYAWPGNVRELRNLAERVVILKREGQVEPADLPPKIRGLSVETKPAPGGATQADMERDVLLGEGRDMKSEVEAFENRMIRQALEATGGNRNQAARLLGVKRTTLVEKLKKRNLA